MSLIVFYDKCDESHAYVHRELSDAFNIYTQYLYE